MSYLNQNGLVDGNIPAGQACPFLDKCSMKFERCPTSDNPKPVAFSCAMARLQSTIREGERRGQSLPLLRKVRDNMGK